MQAKKSSFGDVPSIVSRVVDHARLLRQLRDVEQPEKRAQGVTCVRPMSGLAAWIGWNLAGRLDIQCLYHGFGPTYLHMLLGIKKTEIRAVVPVS